MNESEMPEWYFVAMWLVSLAAFLIGLQIAVPNVSVQDSYLVAAVHMVCLPLISRRMTPARGLPLGLVVIGLAIGFTLIDLCFDLLIVWDRSVSDGTSLISGRKIAWFYYNTMLNAGHVNFALGIFLLVAQFGAVTGVLRTTSPRLRSKWVGLVGMMIVGNGGYLVTVVPRYLVIRASTTFEEEWFDGWVAVIWARMGLLATLGASVVMICSLLEDMRSEMGSRSHAE